LRSALVNKTLVIAGREFSAAVKSKAFLVSLVLMPLMMFGGIAVQSLTDKIADVKDKRIAVIDRSPGGEIAPALVRAADSRNANSIFDENGKQNKPKILIEVVKPTELADEDAVKRQRLELSNRVRSGEMFAFLEIGPDVLSVRIEPTTKALEAQKKIQGASPLDKIRLTQDLQQENNGARYSTNKPTNRDVRDFLQQTLAQQVYTTRARNAGLDAARLFPLLAPPGVISHGLTRQDAAGKIKDADRDNEIATMMVPLGMLFLMFIVVMVGASPMTANMIEEKQLRIAEVLLGSVSPFQLMMGKLLGGVATALTLAAIYFAGAYWGAKKMDIADTISPNMIVWFLLFVVMATLMYGALFVAAGAAVTNIKEAQSLITPIMLIVVLPMFVLGNMLKDPSGPLATAATFFPTSAPMITVARLGIPPGVPAWQLVGSALITLLTTIVLVWAAGRIFRVGILMQGQGAKFGQMLKWVVSG
jgi:ABC-2 type transport system permease protein